MKNKFKNIIVTILKFESLQVIIVMVLSFLFHMAVFNYFDCWMCTDTDGYWLHAATFTGHDWSGVAEKMNFYYGWGYSIFLTIPFMISNNIRVMYRIAILINGLLCAGIVPVIYSLIKRIASGMSKFAMQLTALCVSLYSSYILATAVTMSETLIFFLTVLSLWLFYLYLDTDKPVYGILTAISVGYLYCVHNRNIGIVIALFIIVIVRSIYEKRSKDIWVMLLPLVGMVLLKHGVDYWLTLTENTMGAYTRNTYGNMLGKASGGIGLYGILSLVQNVIGELWYMLIGTFLVAGIGVFEILSNRLVNEKKAVYKHTFFYAYSILSWLFMVAISVFSCVRKQAGAVKRMDIIFYGRYMENTIVFFVLMGIVYLWGNRKDAEKKKEIGLVFIIAVAISVITYYIVASLNVHDVNWFSVVAVMTTAFYPDLQITIISSSIIGLVMAAVIIYLFNMGKEIYKYISVVLLAGIFLFVGYHATYAVSKFYEERASLSNNPTFNLEFNDICNYVWENEYETIYVLSSDPYDAFAYQLVMNKKTIVSITERKDIEMVPDGIPILIKKYGGTDTTEFDFMYENEVFGIYVK